MSKGEQGSLASAVDEFPGDRTGGNTLHSSMVSVESRMGRNALDPDVPSEVWESPRMQRPRVVNDLFTSAASRIC